MGIGLQEKIKHIKDSDGLKRIPTQYLPEAIENDYFFISYSHKDYKSVYIDLLLLQTNKLQFWYDLEMSVGTSWEIIASRHMVPFQCKGVIFYVSENSLKSNSFIKELEYAKRFNKPIVTINLPFESNYIFNGENVKGKVFSAKQMLLIMKENNEEIPEFDERRTVIEEYFPDDVIYLPFEMDPTQKVKQIKLKIRQIPLLEFDEKGASITKLNDHDLFGISKDELLSSKEISLIVSKNLFANCLHLKKINFGDKAVRYDSFSFAKCINLSTIENTSEKQAELYDGAFFECSKLVSFKQNNDCLLRGKMVFKGCESLENITINCESKVIPDETFSNCSSLKTINFSNQDYLEKIGTNAFHSCTLLETISIPNNVAIIDENAFTNCSSLSEVVLSSKITEIGNRAFENCASLKSIILPDSLKLIGYKAFEGCDSLTFNEHDGILYLPSKSNPYFALIKVLDKEAKQYAIHNECVVIAGGAFEECNGIEEIKIPKTVISIGKRAFYNCQNLIVFSQEGFENYSGTNKQMKRSIIGEQAFADCKYLAVISLDPNIAVIGNRAFENSEFLEDIDFPSTLTKIGSKAFDGCTNFKKFTYEGTPSQFSVIDIGKDNKQFYKADGVFKPYDVVTMFGTLLLFWFIGALIIAGFGAAIYFIATLFKGLLYNIIYDSLQIIGLIIFVVAFLFFAFQLFLRIHYKRRMKVWTEKYRKYKESASN